jgi:hypothetical protein
MSGLAIADPQPFSDALDALDAKQLLPTELRSDLLSELPAEIRERALFSAGVTNAEVLQKVDDGVRQILSGEKTESQVREMLKHLSVIANDEELSNDGRLNLVINTNSDMARGYGFWKQAQVPEILDEYPAYEFYRAEDRKEPRDWPDRWEEAGGQFYPGDSDYPEGRMIALKNDPIWEEISAFGLPYAPFDFNSGMDVRDIDRDEAESLGLIDPEDKIDPQDRGLNEDLQASTELQDGGLISTLEAFLDGIAIFGRDGVLRFIGGGA